MSEVEIVIRLNQTLCSELEDMREMVKTLDFSGLTASIERVQKHGNAMEAALSKYREVFNQFEQVFDETTRNDWDGSSKWVLKTSADKVNKLKELWDNRKVKVS